MRTSLMSWPRRVVAQARQRVTQRAARVRDEGFILLETIIAISLITVIMGAIGTEYVSGLASTARQRAQQVASQLADSSVDQIRALAPSDLITGHDSQSVGTEFTAGLADARIQPWLTSMAQAKDPNAAVGAGTTATIPTVGVTQQLGSIAYTVTNYLGWCYASTTGSTTSCQQINNGGVQYLRAVVAVTWTNRNCGTAGATNSTCYFLTSTLVSTASDPLFQITPPPNITYPTTSQTASIGTAVSLQGTATGGTGTLTWTATALPAGVTISSAGLISGTPTTAGTYNSTLTVTDGLGIIDTQGVTWTVAPAALNITYPTTTQTVSTSAAVSVQATVTGGTGTKTWSVVSGSPLPTGLTMSSSGLITGTPTNGAGGTYNSVLMVTDASGTTDTQAVTWTVLDITNPITAQSVTVNSAVSITATASGKTGTLTWSATSLPTGLSMSTTGVISGTPTVKGSYASTIMVNDSVGTSDSQAVAWTITAAPTPLTITNPGTYVSRLANTTAYSLTAAATGGSGTLSWSATSLPTGLTITTGGVISGTTNTVGVWTSTITVTASGGGSGTLTVKWYIGQPVQLIYPTNGGLSSVHSSQVSIQMIAVGGSGSYQWFGNGGIPTGISLSSSGLFTGTMFPYAGSWYVSIYIKDAGNNNATTYYSFPWYVT
jgi:type II secretory pathway pseudopilin PulG